MRRLTHIAFASLLYIFSQSHALAAGTFTPAEGAEITQSPFSVSWETSASQQWVRAYDAATGDKFFDSGRLRTGSGSVSVDVPENVSDISVIFYEFTGSWESQERTYAVNLGGDDGSGGSGGSVIVSDRISCEAGQYPFDDPNFLDDIYLTFGAVSDCTLGCPEGEYLIAVTCTAGTYRSILQAYSPIMAVFNYGSDGRVGSCTAYSDNPVFEFFDPTGEDTVFFELKASGACMSLPD